MRPRDEARHFRCRAERCELRLLVDFVPYSVMSSAFHTMVVSAVQRMVAKFILKATAVFGAALTGRHQIQAKSIAPCRRKRAAVQVEVEVRVGLSVDPVAAVREGEG